MVHWREAGPIFFTAQGQTLEGVCIGPPPGEAMTLMLLHDGLDSLASWGDFPERVARATGCGVFAWSRAGFGRSDPIAGPDGPARLDREALEVLPAVLESVGFRRGVLVGHGEGAVLASLYAGSVSDHRVRGLVLISPRFFREPGARALVEASDPEEVSGKGHRHPQQVFESWRRCWTDPAASRWSVEEVIDYLRVPVLAIRGTEDPYGSSAQLEVLEERSYCPVEFCVLEGCGHAPHHERTEETLAALADFTSRLRRIEEVTAR